MTRRLTLALILALAAPALVAESSDRDILLTPGGTLYTIESDLVENFGITAASLRALKLTIQRGEESESLFVPESLKAGYHSEPALAYETETDTLFVFWQRTPNLFASELLFVSYRDGEWSEVTSIDAAPFRFRKNLRIGVTRYLQDKQAGASKGPARGTVIHTAWWEESGAGQMARYAMLSVENGKVQNIYVRDLLKLVSPSGTHYPLPAEASRELLTQPLIFGRPANDAVEVLFGDWINNSLFRVEIIPIRDFGVLIPPIGHTPIEMPVPIVIGPSGRVSGISGPTGSDKVVLYFESDSRVSYVLYDGSSWSELTSISLNSKVSVHDARNALRKMAASE